MLDKADKKQAAREFKERKAAPGIFALRCRPSDRIWVDSSPNLNAAQNSQFFQLRNRSHRNAEMQAEWNQHGEEAFSFEVLEALPEDTPPLNVHDLLKERKRSWTAQLVS